MARAWTKRLPKAWVSAIARLGTIRLVVGAIALIGFVLLSALTTADVSFAFETDLIIWLQANVTGRWGWLLSLSYYAGDTESAGVVTAVVLIYLLLRKWWREALWFAVATAGALVLVGEIFKPLFNKARPPFSTNSAIHGAAFPSGHGTGNTILYLFIAYLLAAQYPDLGHRFHVAAIIWLICMGFGSLQVGAHWPTDMLGGYCLGFLWLLVCLTLLHASSNIPGIKNLSHRHQRPMATLRSNIDKD